jgi:hypothetical protein
MEMMHLWGCKMIIVMIAPPIGGRRQQRQRRWRRIALGYRAKKARGVGMLQRELQWFCIAILSSLLCREVRMIMQNHWCTFTLFMLVSVFCNIFCFCYIFDVVHRFLRTVVGVLFNPNKWNLNLLLYFCAFFFWLNWEQYKSLQWEIRYSNYIFLSIGLMMSANLHRNDRFWSCCVDIEDPLAICWTLALIGY